MTEHMSVDAILAEADKLRAQHEARVERPNGEATAHEPPQWHGDVPPGEAPRASGEAKNNPAEEPVFSAPPISKSEWDSARLAPDCIVHELLYADVCVVCSPGGTGKTTLMLHVAACIVLGRKVFDLEVRKSGPVVFVTAEDSREMMVARLRAVCLAMQLSEIELDAVQRDVHISDVSGQGLKLTFVADDVVMPSGNVNLIADALRDTKPVLVIFDPAVSFGVGEARVNDAEQGLVEAARRLRNLLRCCPTFVHHTGKANARDKTTDQYSSRGGSALPDGCRMVHVLTSLNAQEWRNETGTDLDDGETGVKLSRPKLTFCRSLVDEPLLIRRRGYSFQRVWPSTATAAERQAAIDRQVLARIASECSQGRYPTKDWLENSAAGEMELSRAEIRGAVSRLLHSDRIEQAERPGKRERGFNSYLRPVPKANHDYSPQGDADPGDECHKATDSSPTGKVADYSPPPIEKKTAANNRAVVFPSALLLAEATMASNGEECDQSPDDPILRDWVNDIVSAADDRALVACLTCLDGESVRDAVLRALPRDVADRCLWAMVDHLERLQ